MNIKKLADKFPEKDIEWRVQRAGKNNYGEYAVVLAYVTNRAIMERLDEVCEPQNWCNEFRPGPEGGVICGISVRFGDDWVTKWDGAENTDIESVKGGLSSAMKRAGVQWGIGRYLYGLEATYATISDKGKHQASYADEAGKKVWFKWDPPKLPKWALPFDTSVDPDLQEAKNKTIDYISQHESVIGSDVVKNWYLDVDMCKTTEGLEDIHKQALKVVRIYELANSKSQSEIAAEVFEGEEVKDELDIF